MMMSMAALAEWREKFDKTGDTPQMKTVAKAFRNEFDLWQLKGHQIYELLRDQEEFFQLLKEVVE